MPERLTHTTASQIMITRLITVRPEQAVHEAVGLLLKNRISGAPVVDADHHLVGMLSEKDCINALTAAAVEGVPFTSVGETMSTRLTTITEDTNLLTIAHKFINGPFRRLPVVRGELLVGQISRRDLLRAMHEMMQGTPSGRFKAIPLYLSALTRSSAQEALARAAAPPSSGARRARE